MTIGEQIRQAREDRDWSRSELARQAGISHTHVRNVEEGGNPSIEVLAALGKALGLDFTIGRSGP